MLAREEGQILPGLLVLMAVTISLGVLFFQVGKASVFRSDAQNAADAAALAGAKEIQRQLWWQYATYGYTTPDIDEARVVAEMEKYADKNGGTLVKHELNALAVDVRAWTTSERALGEDAKPAKAQDVKATARARAQVSLGPYTPGDQGAGSPVAPGHVAPGDVPRITEEDWKELKDEIGPEPRDCPDVISLGLLLVQRGFMVWQNDHPALGGDAGHTRPDQLGSAHHDCNDMGALDVNFGPAGNLVPIETRAIDPLIAPLHELGYSTIWRDGGMHDNHLHVDIRGSSIGALGGSGGFTGALDHATLEIRLVDWEKPVESLVNIGGPWPTTSDLYGPPDPKIMALMCQMAGPLGDKILLAVFEGAIVESGIHNLDWGDRDSLGLYQQRESQGWGPPSETLHPPTALRKFLAKLVPLARKYPHLSAGQLTQLVQVSGHPERYDNVEDQAKALIARSC